MTLDELGFHKSAGAQKDLYQIFKPRLLESINVRNFSDYRTANQNANRLEKAYMQHAELPIHEQNAQNKRGPFALVAREETPLTGKTQANLMNQIHRQGWERSRKSK